MMRYDNRTRKRQVSEVVQANQHTIKLNNTKDKRKKDKIVPLDSEHSVTTSTDSDNDCVFLFDAEMKCIDISKAALQLFPGRTKKKDIIGKHLLDISLGLNETGRYRRYMEVMKTGIPISESINIPGPKFADISLSAQIYQVNDGLGITVDFSTDSDELKQVVEEIREAAERYDCLVERTNDIIYVLDEKAVVTYVTPNIESVAEYNSSEMVGRNVSEYIYPEDLVVVIERFRSGSFPQIPSPFEFRILTKSGEVRWVRNSPRTLFSKNRLIGYQGVLNDITDHKRADEDLKSKEQLFRALIENASDAIVIVNPDATIRYESPSMERITGRAGEERIGGNPLEYCHPEDVLTIMDAFVQLLEKKIAVAQIELRLQHKDGQWLTFEVIGTNLIDDSVVNGIVINLRDITKRKQMEEQYRTLVETMTDGIAVLCTDGLQVYVNNKYCKMTGYTKDELIGHSPLELMDEDNRDLFNREMIKRRKGKSDPYELEFIKKDGSRFIANISPQVITDSEGEIVGAFAVITDITRLKEVEAKLLKSEKNLKLAQEIAHMGHWEWDISARKVELSEEMQRIFGYDQNTAIFSGRPKIIHPNDIIMLQEAIEEIKIGNNPVVEFRLVLPNGDIKWVMAGAIFTDIEAGIEGKIFGYALDITERKKAEEKLKQSEEKYRLHFESVDDVVFSYDHNYRITSVSPSVEKHLGYKSEELEGKLFTELNILMPESLERASKDALRVFANEETFPSEYEFIAKDGTIHLGEVSSAPLFSVDGKLIEVVSVARDITERKRMEKVLKENEETLRHAQHLAQVGSWTWNLKANSFVLSDEMSHIYGIEAREFGSFEDIVNTIVHPDDRKGIFAAADRVISEGYGDPLFYRVIRPDGEVRWISATVPKVRHHDVDGNPEIIVGAVQDITEQKLAEDALRESQEKLRTVFDSIGDGITVLDLGGTIVDVNQTVLSMKGYNREDVIGRFGLDFVAEKDHARATEEMMALFSGEVEHTPATEYALITKDGSHIPCEASASLLRDGSGNVVGLISVERDLRERKQAEQQLHISEERLRAFMDSSVDIYAIFDSELRLLDISDRGVKAFLPDKTREEQIGKHLPELVPEVIETGRYEEYLKVIETGEPYQVEETIIHPRYATRHISLKAFKVKDGMGLIIGDITDRVQAEQKIKENEEQLRSFMESATDVFNIWDSNLDLIYTPEKGIKEYFPPGTKKEDLLGKNILEIAPATKNTGRYDKYLEVIRTGKPFFTEDVIPNTMFGHRHIAIKAFKSGNCMGQVIIDTTKQKQADEKLQKYADRLRAMARQLSEVEESQRHSIARELHDKVGQNITALGINLNIIKAKLEKARKTEELNILNDSQFLIEQIAESIRDVMAKLLPPVLEDYGILAALKWYGQRFALRTGIAININGEEPDPRLSADIEITLFRIYQEALTNISKHAKASNVTVNLYRKNGIQRLLISDDGAGFDTTELSKYAEQASWGLVTMSERALSIDASFEIESTPGIGTRIIVEI